MQRKSVVFIQSFLVIGPLAYCPTAEHPLLNNVIEFLYITFFWIFLFLWQFILIIIFLTSFLSVISVLCCTLFLHKLMYLSFHPIAFVLISSKQIFSPLTLLCCSSMCSIAFWIWIREIACCW